MAAEKADIREQVGIALNTSALVTRSGETDLDRVAALGAAALEVSLGADLAGVPIAAAAAEVYRRSADMRDVMLDPGDIDPGDRLAGELGPLLWHIRYGGQLEPLPQAIHLYAQWLQGRGLFLAYSKPEHLAFVQKFSTAVLHEWLSDMCQPCGGSGKLERTRSGAWIRPRGSMQRNATFGVCASCKGTGRARPSHGARARWIGVTHAKYESDRWEQRFAAALMWLNKFHARRMHRPLTAQLERYKKRI